MLIDNEELLCVDLVKDPKMDVKKFSRVVKTTVKLSSSAWKPGFSKQLVTTHPIHMMHVFNKKEEEKQTSQNNHYINNSINKQHIRRNMMPSSRRIQQDEPVLRLAIMLVIGLSAVLFFPQQQQQQYGAFAFSSSSWRSSRILPHPSRRTTGTAAVSAASAVAPALSMTATTTATMLPEGLLKTIVTPGGRDAASNVRQGDYATIKYTCYAVPEVAANDEKTTDKRTTQANILLARSDSEKMVRREL